MSKKILVPAAVALGLAVTLSGAALAAGGHDHDAAAGPGIELTLNDGQKWPTDDALRLGMSGMQAMLATSLGQIDAGAFTPSDYAALADDLQTQVDYVVTNCRLPEEADAQLHIVLGEIFEGMDAMRAGEDPSDSVLRVARALDAYGRHFDHPGWTPVAH